MRDPHKNPKAKYSISEGIYTGRNKSQESFLRQKEGTIADAINGRVTRNGLPTNSYNKIQEGVVIYDRNVENNQDYYCMISTGIGNNLFDFYIHKDNGTSYFFINEKIVLSANIGYLYSDRNNVQYDINERTGLGEIYIINKRTEPLIFNIEDLLSNITTEKYFNDFKLEMHSVNYSNNLNTPVFCNTVVATNGGGLAYGQYSYSYRYVNKKGSYTNWSIPTPLIPIIKKTSVSQIEGAAQSDVNIHIRNIVSYPQPTVPTGIGIEIKMRIDNKFGYDYIEIKRTDYKSGEGLNFVPQSKIIKKIKIETNQFSVFRYTDSINEDESHIMISEVEEEDNLSFVKSANAVKYVENRLLFGGIETFSRKLSNSECTLKGSGATGDEQYFHFTTPIGRDGFSSAHNCVNYRSLFNAENYSWAIVCFDGNFRPSFAKKIVNSLTTPSAREHIFSGTLSDKHTHELELMNTGNTVSTKVYDFIDNYMSVGKVKTVSSTIEAKNITTQNDNKAILPNGDKVGYKPNRPVNEKDNRSTHNYTPLFSLGNSHPRADYFVDGVRQEITDKKLFNPIIRSLGFGVNGIENFPSWAKAFSIVRTKRAGRILAQGLAFYHLFETLADGATDRNCGELKPCSKSLNKIVFQSPDLISGIVDSNIINSINANPGFYKIELVKPLGFLNEVYFVRKGTLGIDCNTPEGAPGGTYTAGSMIDQVLYANIDTEKTNRKIETNDPEDESLHLRFDAWMNSVSNSNSGLTKIGITSIKEEKLGCQGGSRYVIELEEDIYVTENTGKTNDFKSNLEYQEHRDWLEPIYIVNIVQSSSATVQDSEYQTYQYANNFIKLKSVIGYGNGKADQSFEIVDERIEDFSNCVQENKAGFIYVDQNGDGIYHTIVNVTDYLDTPVIMTSINDDIANGTTTTFGVVIHGKFTTNYSYADEYQNLPYQTESKPRPDIFVIFNQGYVPQEGAIIEVRYDSNKNIKVFGGDAFVGINTHSIIDRRVNDYEDDCFFATRGFPFHRGVIRNDYYQLLRSSDTPLTNILVPEEETESFSFDGIRQMIVSYYCQSYANSAISFGEFFPNVHYSMRPLVFNQYIANKDRGIFEEYYEDRPSEEIKWFYGGFKAAQDFNIDYSKELNTIKFFSYPEISFEEKTYFPCRVVCSLQRGNNQSFSENIKIFRAFNSYDISDKHGEIKRFAVCNEKSGTTLFCFMEDDIAVLNTDKRTISSIDGEALSVIGADGVRFINSHIFIGEQEKKALNFNSKNSVSRFEDFIIYCNTISSYIIKGGDVVDISYGYKEQLQELFESMKYSKTDICSVSNNIDKEYWISSKLNFYTVPYEQETIEDSVVINWTYDLSTFTSNILNLSFIPIADIGNLYLTNFTPGFDKLYIKCGTLISLNVYYTDSEGNNTLLCVLDFTQPDTNYLINFDFLSTENTPIVLTNSEFDKIQEAKVFVYSYVKNKWLSKFLYNFDKFAKINNSLVGSKECKATDLYKGNYLPMSVSININPVENTDKEFKMIRVNSLTDELNLDFFNSQENFHSSILKAQLNRYTDSSESLIPVSQENKRLQGEYCSVTIKDESDNYNEVSSIEVSYKKLK